MSMQVYTRQFAEYNSSQKRPIANYFMTKDLLTARRNAAPRKGMAKQETGEAKKPKWSLLSWAVGLPHILLVFGN